MPVTLNIVDHPVTGWTQPKRPSAEELLQHAAPRQHVRHKGIVQTSFVPSELKYGYVSASENGFVWAAYHAYSNHHHLRIRPEDVWFAILTQISFFINAHAEELRSFFVAHQGKKKLEAISEIADFALLAVQMGELIGSNVVDPQLKDWVLPGFSTTTHTDTVVGSVLFMGAMQKYFDYGFTVTCGLPSVTLLGTVEDWEDILGRLDRLDLLGDEPQQFAAMLRPVLRHMILSFKDPKSAEVLDFWNTIVHRNVMGSGTDYLSGWLTAFCFWDEEGKAKGGYRTALEGVSYPTVNVDEVPAGLASVPVSVDDNGNKYEAALVAGSAGILATSSDTAPPERVPVRIARGDVSQLYTQHLNEVTPVESRSDTCNSSLFPGEVGPPIRDTVQAVSGWWMFKI